MTVRFSKHALQRLRERFDGRADLITAIVERGVSAFRPTPRYGNRRLAAGTVQGRLVKVVFAEIANHEFLILTLMWVGQ